MPKKVSKNNTELLCRMAWEEATNNKETDIDDWIKTTFDTRFNELPNHTSKHTYITKKNVERLCRVAWWDARVNFDVYSSIQAWLNKDFEEMTKDIKKNIINKSTINEPITHVYAVVYEDNISGLWTSPEIAVEYWFENELTRDGGIDLRYSERLFTVQEAVKEMLKPGADYPYLAKIKINPLDGSEMWELPR